MIRSRGGTPQRAASLLLGVGLALLVLRRVHGRFTRYVIAGDSMAPSLRPGDFVVVDRGVFTRRLPRAGEVVLAPDPRDAARQLVKRVRDCDPATGAWLEGDNSEFSTDSRHFGRAPIASISGRVLWRYWPPRSFGPVGQYASNKTRENRLS